MKPEQNMSMTGDAPAAISTTQKIASAIGLTGLFILLLSIANVNFPNKTLFLVLSLGMITLGTVIFANDAYLGKHAGIKNDGVWFKSNTARGFWAWIVGISLTLFYVILYWYPQYLGLREDGANTGIIALFDPLSQLFGGSPQASGLSTEHFTPWPFLFLAINLF